MSSWSKVGLVGPIGQKWAKLVKKIWSCWSQVGEEVGETLVKRWSKVGQGGEALLTKCYKLIKLVTSWSWWKVGENSVTLVKSWWICEKMVDLVKFVKESVKLVNLAGGWSSWLKVGEKLVKSWWKVGEKLVNLAKLVKSWWKVGKFGEKLVKKLVKS